MNMVRMSESLSGGLKEEGGVGEAEGSEGGPKLFAGTPGKYEPHPAPLLAQP